jgi:hypothetical protein
MHLENKLKAKKYVAQVNMLIVVFYFIFWLEKAQNGALHARNTCVYHTKTCHERYGVTTRTLVYSTANENTKLHEIRTHTLNINNHMKVSNIKCKLKH